MSQETTVPARRRALSIQLRTALLAWLVALLTLTVFVLAILPWQKRLFIDNLNSKAYAVTVSLSEVAASAVVYEDYSSVVDHCVEMLKRDPSIEYIVFTRNDGFSLIHTREGWDSRTLAGDWRPEQRVTRGEIRSSPLVKRKVFAYAQPFDYSAIGWGWIHVGLTVDTYEKSLSELYRRTAVLGCVCLLIALITSLIYARQLLRPILRLERTVGRVASGDLTARAEVERQDELGRLAEAFNRMSEALLIRDHTLQEARDNLEHRVQERTRELELQIVAREQAHRELAEAQRRLIQISREAGMAEVATGILHNVGNVLNSVNVSANILRDEIASGSRLALLRQTVDLMQAQGDELPRFLVEDERGRLIMPMLIEIAAELDSFRGDALHEFQSLTQNVDHIKQIIAVQQRYAKVGGLLQDCVACDLFEDAISLNTNSLQRHGVSLVRQFPEAPTRLCTDRHLVLQILVNLLKNAIQAVKQVPEERRHITLRIEQQAGQTRFTVMDQGIGIAPEDRSRLFQHGFTTRKDGHGFGLHSGALAARNLGGSLDFESEGLNCGARFTLSLPNQTPSPNDSNA